MPLGAGNYTLHDLLGLAIAAGLFPVFLVAPGYVVGWLSNVFSFRRQVPAWQAVLSLALSVAVSPIVTYLTFRLGGMPSVWWLYGVGVLTCLGIIAGQLMRSARLTTKSLRKGRSGTIWLVTAAAWVLLAAASLVDVQIGDRLYASGVSYDYAKHVAVTDALVRTGVPPINPEFSPGKPVELYYYYFWFLISSLVARLGAPSIGARDAVMAGTVWTGLALLAMPPLYLRWLVPGIARRVGGLRTAALIGIGLFLVTGLDVLPVTLWDLRLLFTGRGWVYYDIEWWNADELTAWIGSLLWVPHHVAGLVACLVGLLLARAVHRIETLPGRLTAAALAGVSWASGAGLSIWTTFAFGVFAVVWLVLAAVRRWRGEVFWLMLSWLVAAALISPYLADLRRANQLTDSVPITVGVRPFGIIMPMTDWLGVPDDASVLKAAINLIFLPLNYFMELGFFAVAAILFWNRRIRAGERPGRDELTLIILAGSSLLIASLLKSTLKNNDLGWRSFLPVQFALLLWSVEPTYYLPRGLVAGCAKMAERPRRPSGLGAGLAALLALGALSTACDLISLRGFTMLQDESVPVRNQPYADELKPLTGSRTFGMRQIYEDMRQTLPSTSVVQYNPGVSLEIFHGLYGNRQVAAADPDQGKLFGIPDVAYRAVADPIALAFTPNDVEMLSDLDGLCRSFGIMALVVKDTDPVWQLRESWVWHRVPLLANGVARVIPCGTSAPAAASVRDN